MTKKPKKPEAAIKPGPTIRGPDPSHPDSISHPSHKEQWLELARAMGRMDAKRDFETMYGKGRDGEGGK